MPHIAIRREPVDSLQRGRACCRLAYAQKAEGASVGVVGLAFQSI
jgi:hypothetical protein